MRGVCAMSVELYECPDCAFCYDAAHAYPDGTHVCPNCVEEELRAEIKVHRAARDRLQMVVDEELGMQEEMAFDGLIDLIERRLFEQRKYIADLRRELHRTGWDGPNL